MDILINVPAGAGTGLVADLRSLKSNRSYVLSGPDQAHVQVELSPDGITFVPIKTLLFEATGAKSFDNASGFVRTNRLPNGGTGAVFLWVTADSIESCSGSCGGCLGQTSFNGSGATVSNVTPVAIGIFTPPVDGTYTIEWHVTGTVTATGAALAWVVRSVFKVIGGVITKISDTITLNVDEPTTFGDPVSAVAGTNIELRVPGALATPATYILNACVQVNLSTIPV